MMTTTIWMMINNSVSLVNLIITAAGSSTRLGTGKKKEYLSMQDKENNTVLSLACIAFLNAFFDDRVSSDFRLNSVVITCPKERTDEAKTALFSNEKVKTLFEKLNVSPLFVEGGETRQLSVLNALMTCNSFSRSEDMISNEAKTFVLIHDGARPWIDFQTIFNVLSTVKEKSACVPVIPVTDTIAIQKDGAIDFYINRSAACGLQTPQAFDFHRLLDAHKQCVLENRKDCTDDTTIWKAYCGNVFTCPGSSKNIKITFIEDLEKISHS